MQLGGESELVSRTVHSIVSGEKTIKGVGAP
jgi:hypothetical protein